MLNQELVSWLVDGWVSSGLSFYSFCSVSLYNALIHLLLSSILSLISLLLSKVLGHLFASSFILFTIQVSESGLDPVDILFYYFLYRFFSAGKEKLVFI